MPKHGALEPTKIQGMRLSDTTVLRLKIFRKDRTVNDFISELLDLYEETL